MCKPADAFGGGAEQHFDHVDRAKSLSGSVDAAQRLSCRLGAVEALDGIKTRVAITARLARITERLEQDLPSTGCGLAQAKDSIEFTPFDALLLVRRFPKLDQFALLDHILDAIRHPSIGGEPVAPGTASFLIVGFD